MDLELRINIYKQMESCYNKMLKNTTRYFSSRKYGEYRETEVCMSWIDRRTHSLPLGHLRAPAALTATLNQFQDASQHLITYKFGQTLNLC